MQNSTSSFTFELKLTLRESSDMKCNSKLACSSAANAFHATEVSVTVSDEIKHRLREDLPEDPSLKKIYRKTLASELIRLLPTQHDILQSLRGSTVFSSMDIKQGCFQQPIEERDRFKTAFVTPHKGLERFMAATIGLATSPGFFFGRRSGYCFPSLPMARWLGSTWNSLSTNGMSSLIASESFDYADGISQPSNAVVEP
ncbi:hypothetical protein ACJ73_01683 [Blastomyces percursus]|uniref:Uncharacterized protein n=1 Tax=Blastomyces percursus TaxID=1658174 RepID=A0A1J9QEI4_9EURO|nr:hypothetical protein ACJ73_01683 [Blastomyces percursus]